MEPTFHLFGLAHLLILGTIVALAAALAAAHRGASRSGRLARLGLAVVLLLDCVVNYGLLAYQGKLYFPDRLPLELCDTSYFLVILALFTLNKKIFDFTYYCALAGASMALLTPDLKDPWLSFGAVQYFISHGMTVTGTLYLLWSGQARPQPGSVGRVLLWVNLFAAVLGAFNYLFKTDYMYLCTKPRSATALDYLGPWPWYIPAVEVLAFCLFQLLYLPYRKPAVRLDRQPEFP